MSPRYNIKNRVSLSTGLILFIWGLFLIWLVTRFNGAMLYVVAGYVIASISIAALTLKRQIANAESNADKFKRFDPFLQAGSVIASFEYPFSSSTDLSELLRASIAGAISRTIPESSSDDVTLTDVDDRLINQDGRGFQRIRIGGTPRGTEILVVAYHSTVGEFQCFRWWVIAKGFIDADRAAKFVGFAPLSFPRWARKLLSGDLSAAGRLRHVCDSSYNEIDINALSRCAHQVVFDEFIATLDRNDVDVSELRAMRSQVTNINVSGGKLSMGDLIQATGKAMVQQATGGGSIGAKN